MIRFILTALAIWGVILTIILLVGGWLSVTSKSDHPRRVRGRCAVPGCGRKAGHWKAAAP